MRATSIGLARVVERSAEEDPVADAVLALSVSTAAVLALLEVSAGRPPATAAPGAVVLVASVLRFRRIALLAATVVWVGILGPGTAGGLVATLVFVGLCVVLVVGPGNVLDWLEDRWDARRERIRREREARAAAVAEADGIEAVGWIEELPEAPISSSAG